MKEPVRTVKDQNDHYHYRHHLNPIISIIFIITINIWIQLFSASSTSTSYRSYHIDHIDLQHVDHERLHPYRSYISTSCTSTSSSITCVNMIYVIFYLMHPHHHLHHMISIFVLILVFILSSSPRSESRRYTPIQKNLKKTALMLGDEGSALNRSPIMGRSSPESEYSVTSTTVHWPVPYSVTSPRSLRGGPAGHSVGDFQVKVKLKTCHSTVVLPDGTD